ncbi:MAG: hypothetical protein SOX45_04070 [Lachnospiraceae bacterium]|nr:hypothetical protein [Lachnospiraceae bacterium]
MYKCDYEYCGKEFWSLSECEEHEKSHLRNYQQEDTDEIIRALRHLGEIAYGYHMGNMVFDMPVRNFESLMDEAAKRLDMHNLVRDYLEE